MTTEEKARRYESMMASSQPTVTPNPAKAHAAIEEKDSNEDFITYLAYSATTSNHSTKHFLIDTGANTHVVCESSLLHDIHPMTPVRINGLAGSGGQVTASHQGSATVPGITSNGNP